MSTSPTLEYIFHAVWIVLAVLGLNLAIRLYRKKIEWPQARRMGIPMTMFAWMNFIYGLVLFEGAFGIVSVVLNLPLWMDVGLFLVIFGISVGVYFKLRHRAKFNAAVFTALFLIPLSIPGTHAAAKLIPTMGTIIPAVGKFVPVLPGIQAAKKLLPFNAPEIQKLDKIVKHFPQWSPPIGDSGFRVLFKDTLEKGRFGDWLTTKSLVVQGYRKLPSKVDIVHGIDGVFARYHNGNLRDILIVETKVDGGKLMPGQMTDRWVGDRVEKMIAHSDEKVRQTGMLIRDNISLVRKELWHHALGSGVTTVSYLDAEATKTLKRTLNSIDGQVRKRCQLSTTTLTCAPAA